MKRLSASLFSLKSQNFLLINPQVLLFRAFLNLPVRELEVFPIKADKSDLKLALPQHCSRRAARHRHPRYYV